MPGDSLFPPAPCASTKRQRGSHSAGYEVITIESSLVLSVAEGTRVANSVSAITPRVLAARGRPTGLADHACSSDAGTPTPFCLLVLRESATPPVARLPPVRCALPELCAAAIGSWELRLRFRTACSVVGTESAPSVPPRLRFDTFPGILRPGTRRLGLRASTSCNKRTTSGQSLISSPRSSFNLADLQEGKAISQSRGLRVSAPTVPAEPRTRKWGRALISRCIAAPLASLRAVARTEGAGAPNLVDTRCIAAQSRHCWCRWVEREEQAGAREGVT